ncbi:MAG: hypothetical protein EOP11_06690 [Proteobacteria bacterium]|nr:MAG: hypothetical protein EOP11_06690 [Pseudomonadota bacterium]
MAFADFDCKAGQGDTALHVELDSATQIGYVTVYEGNASSLVKGSYSVESEVLSQKIVLALEGDGGKIDFVEKTQFCGRAGCWDSKPTAWKAKWSGKQGDAWFSCNETN